jgi:hypothetical protein
LWVPLERKKKDWIRNERKKFPLFFKLSRSTYASQHPLLSIVPSSFGQRLLTMLLHDLDIITVHHLDPGFDVEAGKMWIGFNY